MKVNISGYDPTLHAPEHHQFTEKHHLKNQKMNSWFSTALYRSQIYELEVSGDGSDKRTVPVSHLITTFQREFCMFQQICIEGHYHHAIMIKTKELGRRNL